MEPVGIGLRVEGPPLDAHPCGLDTERVRKALAGGAVGVASEVGAVAGVDRGVIAASGDGLSRKGAGVVAGTADATEPGFGFNRYQAATPIPQNTKRPIISSMGRRTFTGPLPAGVSGALHCGHTNSAPSGI